MMDLDRDLWKRAFLSFTAVVLGFLTVAGSSAATRLQTTRQTLDDSLSNAFLLPGSAELREGQPYVLLLFDYTDPHLKPFIEQYLNIAVAYDVPLALLDLPVLEGALPMHLNSIYLQHKHPGQLADYFGPLISEAKPSAAKAEALFTGALEQAGVNRSTVTEAELQAFGYPYLRQNLALAQKVGLTGVPVIILRNSNIRLDGTLDYDRFETMLLMDMAFDVTLSPAALTSKTCAAEGGNICNHTGALLAFSGGDDNLKAAWAQFEKSCLDGDPLGCLSSAKLMSYSGYSFGKTTAEEQMKRFQQSCELGNALGCLETAAVLERGHYIQRDRNRATSIVKALCDEAGPDRCAAFEGRLTRARTDAENYRKKLCYDVAAEEAEVEFGEDFEAEYDDCMESWRSQND